MFTSVLPEKNKGFITMKEEKFINGKKIEDFEIMGKFDNGNRELEEKYDNERFSTKIIKPKFRNKQQVRFNLGKNKIIKTRKIERTLTPFIPKSKTLEERRGIIQKVSETNKRKTKKTVIPKKKI